MRIQRSGSLPHHHETVRLRSSVQVAGWAATGMLIGVGLSVVATSDGAARDFVGPLLVMVGAVGIVPLVRCRRLDITVGSRMVEAVTGLTRETLPTGAVVAAGRRPASGWRCLYSDWEVELEVDVGARRRRLPSRDPDALVAVLTQT